MNKTIINYLNECGFTNIRWYHGRKGFFILARRYGVTICIDLHDLMNEMLRSELTNKEFKVEAD